MVDKNPLISVIVPIYNIEDYLNECINSILKQTFNDFELLLIDDGSTDSSASICDKFLKTDNRIKVIHKENGGLSDARNKGVDEARGDFLFFVDGDDFITKECLEAFASLVKTNPYVDIILSSGMYAYFKGRKNPMFESFDINKAVGSGEKVLRYILSEYKGDLWSACCKLYSTKFWKRNGYKYRKGIFCEDLDLTYKIILDANYIQAISKPCYYYRQYRADSIISDHNKKKLTDLCMVILDWTDYINKKSLGKSMEILLKNRWAGVLCTSVMSQVYFYKKSERIELLSHIEKVLPVLNYAKNGIALYSKVLIKILGLKKTCYMLYKLRIIKKYLDYKKLMNGEQ